VKFIAFDPPLARVVPGMFAIQAPAATTKHSEQNMHKISIPREELEEVMLAELQVTVACADVREVAIFGATGLRSGQHRSLQVSFPEAPTPTLGLETVRHVERDLQSKYDMMLGS
jgi:hypothetical protein